MKKTKLKWFTLVEMIIVIVIIGILAVVLTESYITISRVALRVEQEKNLSEESLILTQIFQAISDEATIDYEKYENSLKGTNWFTGTLYLTWGQWSWTSIYTTGESCLELEWNFPANDDGNYPDYSEKIQNALTGCSLVLSKEVENGEKTTITQLTTQWKVVISKAIFKIIPYNNDEHYFMTEEETDIVNSLHQPAFWMFIHLYAPLYQPKWTNKIDQPLQLFFNLKL